MSTETFVDRRFSADSLVIIDTANEICSEYRRQGFNLTLRQVYYQFVARDLLPNSQKSYKRLGSIINDARLAGLMDWSYIQDRTRSVRGSFSGWDNPGQFIESVVSSYNEAIWEGQEFRPEVWVEKDALVDVIGQACRPTRAPYFSCRGYVSQSEMYDAAKRFQRRRQAGLTPVVIHLGDHDPSGIDMTRDIRDRLELMSWGEVEVRRIALNMPQIEQYGPPPNPAKLTDSRGTAYVERYGDDSWELDALEPRVLTSLIADTLEEYIDRDVMDERIEHEQRQEERMQVVADRWTEIDERWDRIVDEILDEQ
jgi:hypothetical protein